MGQPLVAYEIDVLEKLEELSRQMEEVNGVNQELAAESDEKDSRDEELSLNVEEPADKTSMDSVGTEGDEIVGDLSSSPMDTSRAPSGDKGAETDSSTVKEDVPGTEDEVGININDDELWDDGDVEEIPLFEEELLSEISEDEENKAVRTEKVEADEEASVPREGLVETSSQDLMEEESEDLNKDDDGRQEARQEGMKRPPAPVKNTDGLVYRLLPWVVTGLSSVLALLAVLTISLLWKNHPVPQAEETTPPAVTSRQAKPAANVPKANTGSQYEAIDLAPFIIPGKSGGELVFFKLQVELVVPDAITKQELMRRQAWLRDIIYQELKGLDISRGLHGDILTRYRAPLLKRLNMEFAPLRIEDIRLMGYLLR